MRAWLAALMLVLAAPGAAGAATARVDDGRLHYVAGPAEANRVGLVAQGGQITLTDLGAEIAVEDGCNAIDLQRVTCTAGSVWAELGDGDDSIESLPEADTFHGGEGVDTLNYETRTEDLVVDLADPGIDGGDTTTGFENIAGGRGQDKLYGTAADNVIDAGGTSAGADLLVGRGGNDTLLAGAGGSELSGGRGDDVLVGGDGTDSFGCGRGDEDIVQNAAVRLDYLTSGCEALRNRRLVLSPIGSPVGDRELRYVLECPGPCEGAIVLRRQRDRRVLGRGTFGGSGRVTVRVRLKRLHRSSRRSIVDAGVWGAGIPKTAWSARFPSR